MDKQLRRSILRTLAYFDTFDFPLTAEELHRWLWEHAETVSLEVVYEALRQLIEAGDIVRSQSFYALANRGEIVHGRQRATSLVKEKMSVARHAGKLIRYLPFVRAFFVCNTVAGSVPHAESDVDVFIVMKQSRLWIGRLIVTVVLGIARLRRTKTKVHNRICLSFYITEQHVNLADVRSREQDIYLAYWIDQLIPVYDPDDLLHTIHAANSWTRTFLPHTGMPNGSHPHWHVSRTAFSLVIQRSQEWILGGVIGNFIEQSARTLQKKKMDANVQSLQHLPDSRVVVNDTMLKFHENDRRELFRQRWMDRCWEVDVV